MLRDFRRSLRRLPSLLVLPVILMLLPAVAAGSSDAEAALAGEWTGVIIVPGQELGIILRFDRTDAGEWTGTGDIPIQGAFNLVLSDIQIDGDRVRFAYRDIPTTSFDGRLSEDGTTIEGLFSQSGLRFPFHITKVVADDTDPEFLDRIRQHAEKVMADWHLPGLALAVIHHGELILVEGFGLRDVERELPVTPDTQFGIGSATKAFTATLFQMFVEEGALDWDRPVREVIPGFRLQDPLASENVTARDFALHRSGLPRHDVAWMFNSNLDADAFIAAAEHLQPAAPFRTTWIYNNFGYVVLGLMIERATGTSWAGALTERILRPLEMESTTLSIAAMRESDDYALGYVFDGESFVEVPLLEISAAAAGAVNSSASDMAKWVLLQLNYGRAGDRQLISSFGIASLHSPQMLMGGGSSAEIRFSSYGLGWMVDSYRGFERVHHGGNTLAYSADVAMIPEKGIGVVVLTNAVGSPAPGILTNLILDTLLELEPIDWSGQALAALELSAGMSGTAVSETRREGTRPAHELEEYAGVYEHPAYGIVTIDVVDERLVATYYETVIPLDHWHFEQFRGILHPLVPLQVPFFFHTDAAGNVSRVDIGFEVMVDPIPFTRRPDAAWIDRDYLEQFVGDYSLTGQTVRFHIQGDTLVMTVPGQPPYRLVPVREGRFEPENLPGFAVEFVFGDDGRVHKAILIQPHGNVELVRDEA